MILIQMNTRNPSELKHKNETSGKHNFRRTPTPKTVSSSKFHENPKTHKPKQNSKHPIQLEQQSTQDWKQETLNTPIHHRTENPGVGRGKGKERRAVPKTTKKSKAIHSTKGEKKTNLGSKG